MIRLVGTTWDRRSLRLMTALMLILVAVPGDTTRTAPLQDFQTRLQAGLSHLAAGRAEEAIREFEQAIKLDPKSGIGYFNLSRAYAQLRRWPEAMQQIDRAIGLEPERPEFYNQRGLIYSQLKQFKKALPDMLRAIELKPQGFLEYFYYNLALVYRDLLRPDDALAACQKALEIAPRLHPAHVSLGEIYLEKNLLDKAIQEFSVAISLQPQSPKAYLQMGIAYARAGQDEKAVEAFDKALELDPNNYRTHYNLSMSLMRLGKLPEAQEHLDVFARLQAQAEQREYEELQAEVAQRTDLRLSGVGPPVSEPHSMPQRSQPLSLVSSAPTSTSSLFRDVTSKARITFKHTNGATLEKYMPETMGSGCLFFDYDGDGWIDIILVNSGSLVDAKLAKSARSTLYRNNQDGTFTDVTAKSGIQNSGYGMGACAADYDNDGHEDLYLTNFGRNTLYHNNGDGTFSDVTQKAGVGSVSWGSSCAFGDVDNDGRVDLFVVNYVDFSLNNHKYCGSHVEGLRSYCHPDVYHGLPNVLYHNNGDGTFTDVTGQARVYTKSGKGLGVALGDYNNDGWADIYVANDSVANFLYRNNGKGLFEEMGLVSGVAVDENGMPRAGMGTDWGDFDNDGLLDIYVTNLNSETNTLYHNNGGGLFTDVTWQAGLGEPTLPFVGFGTAFLDFDNDGWLDLVVANGHILDNVSLSRDNITYAQRRLLFHNEGNGSFKVVGLRAGPDFEAERVGRGLAVGDIDNDGDLDILINNSNQPADLLLNENHTGNHWLVIKTIGTMSNRDGIGTRIIAEAGPLRLIRDVKAGSSYQSQNDRRVHFGLRDCARVERLELHWPSGIVDRLKNLDADQILTIREGEGVVRQEPRVLPSAVTGVSSRRSSVK